VVEVGGRGETLYELCWKLLVEDRRESDGVGGRRSAKIEERHEAKLTSSSISKRVNPPYLGSSVGIGGGAWFSLMMLSSGTLAAMVSSGGWPFCRVLYGQL
jgi:hypothetical protein